MAATRLHGFAQALTAPDRRPPDGLAGPCERRFAVYRNNVAVGLIRALETRFPAVKDLVGEEFFRAMARDFVRRHPPSSPLLAAFGDLLPDFLAIFPPAREMPYLADVAHLEVAASRAYHAADVPRLAEAAFAVVPPQALQTLRVALHPAVAVVRSPHPVATLHAMARGWMPAAPIADWRGEAALIDRPDLDATVRPIPEATAVFLERLARGDALGEAAAAAAADPAFDLPAALAELIGARLACRIDLAEGVLP